MPFAIRIIIMPTATAFTLTDTVSTTVYEFKPVEVSTKRAVFIARFDDPNLGVELIMSFTRSSNSRTVNTASLSLTLPFLTGGSEADGTAIYHKAFFSNGQVRIPVEFDQAQRDSLHWLIVQVANYSPFKGMITALDPIY